MTSICFVLKKMNYANKNHREEEATMNFDNVKLTRKIKKYRGAASRKHFAQILTDIAQRIFPEAPTISYRTIESWEQGRKNLGTWYLYLLYIYEQEQKGDSDDKARN